MPETLNRSRSTHAQKGQKRADPADLMRPITDRRQMVQLRDWLVELRSEHELTYAQIAAYLWRGASKFGYVERLTKGEHLRGGIKPIVLDWDEVRRLRLMLCQLAGARANVRTRCLSLLQRQAELTGEVVELVREVTK